jgi:hypothetical protein
MSSEPISETPYRCHAVIGTYGFDHRATEVGAHAPGTDASHAAA